MNDLLRGKKVAVLVETEYIHDEIIFYKNLFESYGATVDFLTYLWGKSSRRIICDITDPYKAEEEIHTMDVELDIADCDPNDYAIVLIAANYVACRLREIPPMGSLGSIEQLSSPPAVQFIKKAMMRKDIVKGALCHALWLMTPIPKLLKGRNIICHTVVLADIHNAGAVYVPSPTHVVIDHDLVTARSAADLEAYGQALIECYLKIHNEHSDPCHHGEHHHHEEHHHCHHHDKEFDF